MIHDVMSSTRYFGSGHAEENYEEEEEEDEEEEGQRGCVQFRGVR